MTSEAPPEPFHLVNNEWERTSTPHEPLKNHSVLRTPRKSGLWHLFPLDKFPLEEHISSSPHPSLRGASAACLRKRGTWHRFYRFRNVPICYTHPVLQTTVSGVGMGMNAAAESLLFPYSIVLELRTGHARTCAHKKRAAAEQTVGAGPDGPSGEARVLCV